MQILELRKLRVLQNADMVDSLESKLQRHCMILTVVFSFEGSEDTCGTNPDLKTPKDIDKVC